MSEPAEGLPRNTKRWLEALEWHETLTETDQSQLTSALIRDWQAWHADPDNQRIFDRLSGLAADARGIPSRRQCRNREITEDEYDTAAPIALWKVLTLPSGKQRSSRTSWQRRRTTFVAMTAAAAVTALILWPPWSRVGARQGGGATTFETSVGGLKQVHLGDGSEITLGGSTTLLVELSAKVRSVELIRGEAWFRVAHDAGWPFVVHAGNGAITAVGTAFLVTRNSDRVVVTVTEGTISVRPLPPVSFTPILRKDTTSFRPSPSVRVARGEEVSYQDNGVLAPVINANTHAAIAWTCGRLIFDDEPLRYVAEDLNRYFPHRISTTLSAGRVRFSGVILRGEIEEWLQRLPEIVPVDAEARGAEMCIRMRGPQENAACAVAH